MPVPDTNTPDGWLDPRDHGYLDAESDAARRAMMAEAITSFRRRDRLDVGDPAPAIRLATLDADATVRLDGPRDRPLVLVFGSYT